MAGLKIVVVEDEPLTKEGICSIITSRDKNWNVVGIADNGSDGLELIRKVQPDIVITDIRMPHSDGIELITQLRNENHDTIVIILTGYADFKYAQEALKKGVFDYILKPSSSSEIIDVIQRAERIIINKRRSGKTQSVEDSTEESVKSDAHYTLQVRKALEYIRENYYREITLREVSEHVYMNYNYLSQLIKAETGTSFSHYLTEIRLEKAKVLLRDVRYNVNDVAKMVGYNDAKHFSQVFKKIVGVLPTEFKRST